MKRYAIIMAGGAGERFWPLSRMAQPKHLWNVAGGEECLLSQTFARVSTVIAKSNIMVITNAEQIEAIGKICPEIPKDNIIAEPCGRDTSAAISLAAVLVQAKSADSSFAVFPADHVIHNNAAFSETLLSAFEVAEGGDRLVTIGIEPKFPATGYGYIKRGKKQDTSLGEYFKVSRFFEKPNLSRATSYVGSGEYYWNAGIFVWKTSAILSAVKKNIPETAKIFEKIYKKISSGKSLKKALAKNYEKIEKISIDFAVMEKADNAWVVPATFDWDDVGSWSAVERHHPHDANGNVAVGELFAKDSEDCVVFDADKRATALVGVNNIIVVHSGDATLVCCRNAAEELKELVKTLPQKFR